MKTTTSVNRLLAKLFSCISFIALSLGSANQQAIATDETQLTSGSTISLPTTSPTLGDDSVYQLSLLEETPTTNTYVVTLYQWDEAGEQTEAVDYRLSIGSLVNDGDDIITYYQWDSDTGNFGIVETLSTDGTSFAISSSSSDTSYIQTSEDIDSISRNFVGDVGTGFSDYAAVTNKSGFTIQSITANFVGNTTTYNYGGGIANETNAIIGSVSGSFIANKAYMGAGIYNLGTITSIDADFIENSTGNYSGGAIYNTGSIDSIKGDFIGNSSAYGYGGAIANIGGSIETIEAHFINNSADDSDGGAIYNSGTITSIINSSFTGNAAGYSYTAYYSQNGGAISNAGIISTISNTSFDHNSAINYGGAISNWGGEIEEIAQASFIENYAGQFGGAIFNYSSSITKITGTSFIGNSADYYGGAICIYSGSIDEISDSSFSGNSAGYYGGAICNIDSLEKITGTSFIGNSADELGGAICNLGSIGEISDSSFINNSSDMGGAIYNEGTMTIVARSANVLFDGNTATSGGGAIYNEEGTVSLKAASSYSIIINDSIYNNDIIIVGDAEDASYQGSVYLAGEISNGEIQMESGKLYLAEKEANDDTEDEVSTINDASDEVTTAFYTNGTLTLNGGTTYLCSTQSLDNTVVVNAQGGNVDVQDGELNDYTVKEVNGIDASEYSDSLSVFSIDIDLISQTADTFTADSLSGSVAVQISAIDNLNELTEDHLSGDIEIFKLSEDSEDTLEDFSLFIDRDHYIYYTKESALTFYQNTDTVEDRGWIHYELEISEYSLAEVLTDVEGYRIYEMLEDESAVIEGSAQSVMNENGDMQIWGKGNSITSGSIVMNGGNVLSMKNVNLNAEASVVLSATADDEEIAELSMDNDGEEVRIAGEVKGESAELAKYNQVTLLGEGSFIIDNSLSNITLNLAGGSVTLNKDEYFGSTSQEDAGNIINFAGSSVNFVNGQASTMYVNDVQVTDGSYSSVSLDVDLEAGTMDNLISVADTSTGTAGTGLVYVETLNLLSDALNEVTYISFTTDADLMAAVSFENIVGIAGYDETKNYLYDVEYDASTGEFIFTRYNDTINTDLLGADVAAQGAYSTISAAYEQVFTNYDMFTSKNQKERADIEQTRTGSKLWVTPYTTFANAKLANGLDVDEETWGVYVGVDSTVKKLAKDWNMMYSAYAAYAGIQQDYTGVEIEQQGGLAGLSALFYKKKFWSSIVTSVGAASADLDTRTSSDSVSMFVAGLASKSGYNIELKDGDYVIQPNLQVSYSYVNCENYENSAGVDMNVDSLNVFQTAPGLRIISNKSLTWQPYMTAQMVWNFNNSTSSTANGEVLPDVGIKSYVQYGVGTQYRVNEHCSVYGQVMMRHGDHQGFSFNVGFNWDFK